MRSRASIVTAPLLGALVLATSCQVATTTPLSPGAEAGDARAVARAAVDSMGGEARLRALETLHLVSMGHWTAVESSDRPVPPWNVSYDESEEWLDYERGRERHRSRVLSAWRGGALPVWSPWERITTQDADAIILDGKMRAGGRVHIADTAERLFMSPHRLVLAALDAPDLRRAPDAMRHGEPHRVLRFRHRTWDVTLWLDAHTARLSAAEVLHTLPDDYFWNAWGDVRDVLEFQRWSWMPAGVWYPAQCDLWRNGSPYHSTTLMQFDASPLPADTFDIPPDIRADFAANARTPISVPAAGEAPVEELAPGVLFAPARWNALVVAQDGGPVLIDAPISDVYFARTVDEAARRYGKAPAGVVLTRHVIPQIAGTRAAAARGFALYTLDANRELVQRLLDAPHRAAPDALARSPRPAHIEDVAGRRALGRGANRIELVPMRTSLGARTLLVWLPGHALLWVSSSLSLDATGKPVNPDQLRELTEVIRRERLDVKRVVGTSLPPTPWDAIAAQLEPKP